MKKKDSKIKGSGPRRQTRTAPNTKQERKAPAGKQDNKLQKDFNKTLSQWQESCQCNSCHLFRKKTRELWNQAKSTKVKRAILENLKEKFKGVKKI